MTKSKSTRKKWNVSNLDQEVIKEKYKQESERLIDATDNHRESVEEIWKNLKGCLSKTVDAVCGKKTKTGKQNWITVEILNKMEERRMWKKNEKKYRSLSKVIKRMCRKAKSQYYNKICNEIESLDKSHNPKMYEIVKQPRPKKLRSEQSVKNKDGND